jgi:hypothetical protein
VLCFTEALVTVTRLLCNQVNILTSHSSAEARNLTNICVSTFFFLILDTESEIEGQGKMAYYHNDYKKMRRISFGKREGVIDI